MSGPGRGSEDDKDWRPVSSIPTPKGGDGSGSQAGGEPNPCVFTELTVLASPNAQVVASLGVGSVLTVELQEAPLRVVVTHQTGIAGSITSARLADIIECIRYGQAYQARVTQITGGLVQVEIYPI